MKNLETLIQELCPDGVEFVKLGECCTFKRGTTITAKNAIAGDVPVLAGGQKPAYYHNVSNRTGETIVVAGSGAYAGYVSYWTIPVFLSDSFSVQPDNRLVTKFVYYFLKNIQQKIFATKKGSGVPHVHGSSIAKFEIPLPPIEVQTEIVRILDKFTSLEAELEAELDCRKRQYEYYRDKLLSFDNVGGQEVEWKKMSEVCEIRGRIGFRGYTRQDLVEEGKGAISLSPSNIVNGVLTFDNNTYISWEKYDESPEIIAKIGNIVFTKTGSTVGKTALITELPQECTINPQLVLITCMGCNNTYLKQVMQNASFQLKVRKFAGVGSVPNISQKALASIEIPIPPLQEQERIANILDRFESLTTSLQSGLPAEITARRQQYEHYRDKLLTFKRKGAA